MKKLVLAILLLCLAVPAFAQEKTDDELLAETVELSKQVKGFGRILGIEPTEALSKSAKESKSFSLLVIHIQKRGTIGLEDFEQFVLGFELDKNEMPISQYYLRSQNYSVFIRQVTEFAGGNNVAVITVGFAEESLIRKAMAILHEDLHENIHADYTSRENKVAETLVTPLGFLAALKFFEYTDDKPSAAETIRLIDYYRQLSIELNLLEKDIKNLPQYGLGSDICQEIHDALINKYPIYKSHLLNVLRPYESCIAEEAVVTSDLMYWKYFDKVIGFYEKTRDVKTLIEDFKSAPSDKESLEKYLDELDQKYSANNSSGPLLH